jgi:hypothetical protein
MQWLAPAADREDWLRSWQAELWYRAHAPRNRARPAPALSFGLIHDALWLRFESWRRALTGTAALCLAALLALVFFAALPMLASLGGRAFVLYLDRQLVRFACESLLLIFVSFAIAEGYADRTESRGPTRWLLPTLFYAAKMSLLLAAAFLLSTDLCQPFHALLPFTSELLQNLLFVLFALVGLRWNALDQAQRCKQCLRSLATPARIGRPSHNFLEWTGTGLACLQGHGLLTVPEMQTSWRRSSEWIPST